MGDTPPNDELSTGVSGTVVPADCIRLDEVKTGHCATVCDVGAGEDEVNLLKAMGVCPGRRIMLIRRGDPMILRVLGSRLGVSARLASRVTVLPCTDDLCESPTTSPE